MRRARTTGFRGLTPEQQVSYVIKHWDEIWTPVSVEEKCWKSISTLEYKISYFIPSILDEVRGTEFAKYIPEIIRGYISWEFWF